MLGSFVKQIALTPIDSPQRTTRIQILWHTDATTELFATRQTTAQKIRTPDEIVELIRELAQNHNDRQIASVLNTMGLVSGRGRAFTVKSVAWIRFKSGIKKPMNDPKVAHDVGITPDGYYSTSALAKKLGVGIHTIYYWRDKGIIEVVENPDSHLCWYKVSKEVLDILREKIRRVPVLEE